ncbi:hypothetical protein J6590_026751 [Homalodisca vitripennis]|nr:hypothetical protein J6590_026751 [Homalodisca vitripennis]
MSFPTTGQYRGDWRSRSIYCACRLANLADIRPRLPSERFKRSLQRDLSLPVQSISRYLIEPIYIAGAILSGIIEDVISACREREGVAMLGPPHREMLADGLTVWPATESEMTGWCVKRGGGYKQWWR